MTCVCPQVLRDSYGSRMALYNSGTLQIYRITAKDKGYFQCVATNTRGTKRISVYLNVY